MLFDKVRFDLIPHIGAGDIKLGMTRNEIRSILGTPDYSSENSKLDYGDITIPVPAKDGYYGNELQIAFDANNRANFLEFTGRGAKHTQVYLNGIDVFKVPAPKLIQEIKASTNVNFDKEEKEIPYSYVFPEIDLALWRQVTPQSDEEIEDIPDSDDGKYFWTIAIGIKGYYDN